VYPLPAAVNREDVSLWTRRYVQHLLNLRRLHIHAERCPWLLESLSEWQLDVPKGITSLEHLSKRFIRPRHDQYSHACKALEYLVAGVMIEMQRRISTGRRKASRAQQIVDNDDLVGDGSVNAWTALYQDSIFGED
jgi:hypothetical protein